MGLLDYVPWIMPLSSLAVCVLVGWVLKRDGVLQHMMLGSDFFARYRPHLAHRRALCCADCDFAGVCEYVGVDLSFRLPWAIKAA